MRPSRCLLLLLAAAAPAGWWLADQGGERPTLSPASAAVPREAKANSVQPAITAHAQPLPQRAPSLRAVEDPVPAFAVWLQRYQLAEPARQRVLLPEGEALARQRQAVVYQLIATNPREALAAALTEPQRRAVPAALLPLLELPVHEQGDLAVVAATPRPGQERLITRPEYREARLQGRAYDAYVYGRRAQQLTKYGTSLRGIVMNDRMAVADEPAAVLTLADLPLKARLSAGLALGDHTAPQRAEASTPVLAVQGSYYPMCCAAHAALYAEQAIAAELREGPYVEALGQTGISPPPAASANVSTQGAKSVLVIVADFSDAPGRPLDGSTTPGTSVTTSYATYRLATEVSNYFQQISYGKTSIGTVAVTDVLRLSGTLGSYASTNNITGLQSAAISAAKTAGYTTTSYDRVALVFANTHSMPGNKWAWVGLADLGGSFAWFNGDFGLHVVSHEFGHTFGLRHANLWQIPGGSSNPVDPAGTSLEYGDPFDIMGSGLSDATANYPFPSPWFLTRVHWLPDTAVSTISTSGTYRLYRYDDKDVNLARTLALKFGRDAGTDCWLAFRRRYAGSARPDPATGVTMIWAFNNDTRSNLIDIDTPGTNATDAPLNVGSTFNDSAAGISLSVTGSGGSSGSEYLDVQVNFQPRLVFERKSYSVDEQAGTLNLVLQRLNSSTGAVSVHYTTANGSAAAGSDYTAVSGDLSWASGDATSRTISIPILADAISEGAETFSLQLSALSGAVLPSGSSVSITIQEAGAVDPSFTQASFNSAVDDLVVQPDGGIVTGGHFDSPAAALARLLPDGAEDVDFDQQGPGADLDGTNTVRPLATVARQADGKLLVGGSFLSMRNLPRARIARLNVDGTLDTTFDPGTGPNKPVHVITVQPDGKILVGGEFTTWNGSARVGLVRLNEDGSLDTSIGNFDSIVDFFSGFENVNDIVLQPAATAPHFRILVAGEFFRPSSGNGFHSGLIALNAVNGTRDTSFDVSYGAHVAGDTGTTYPTSRIAVQPDGKVLVGGQFDGFNGSTTGHLVRLNSNGTLDTAFRSAMGAGIRGSGYVDIGEILLDGGDHITAVGTFTTASGNTQNCVARYLGTGAFDSSFRPSIAFTSSLLGANCGALELDGKLLVGFNGAGAGNVMRRYFTAQQTPSIVSMASTTVTAPEGGNAVITVLRSGGSLGAISVNYATIARSATADADFTSSTGTLTWSSGDTSARTINVPVASDGLVENDEAFDVVLGVPVGGVLLGEMQTSTVVIPSGDLSSVPHVEFSSAGQTAGEGAGTLTLTVNVNPAAVTAFTVPLSTSGTATQGTGKDYTLGSTSLSFAPGDTSKTVSVTLLQDSVLDPGESAIITLGSPSGFAVLGTTPSHTIAITDDEAAPFITTPPVAGIAALNTPWTFTATATGSPAPQFTWKKGSTTLLKEAAGQYIISNVQTTHAGTYSVVASSSTGSTPARYAELGVLDKADRTLNVKLDGTISLSVVCSSNITGFLWFKNGVQVADAPGHITGFNKKTLTISHAVLSDADTYTCTVTCPNAATSASTGTYRLNVITGPPQIQEPVFLADATVGSTYDQPVGFLNNSQLLPASFTASPLPSGLRIDPDGHIRGTPVVAITTNKPYTVSIKATNLKGSDSTTATLLLHPLPLSSLGSWSGFVARDADVNAGLGGRLSITTTSSSSFTGTLINGLSTHRLTGKLTLPIGSSNPQGTVIIPRTGLPTLTLQFTLDTTSLKMTSAKVSVPGHDAALTGWKHVPQATSLYGQWNGALTLAAPSATLPRGTGYVSFKVTSSGSVTAAGRLADEVAFSTATGIGPTGEVLVHWASSSTDVIVGSLAISAGATLNFSDWALVGSATWSRKAQTASRVYRSGFSAQTVNIGGGLYVPPTAAEPVMHLAYNAGVTTSNAALAFTLGDFGDPVSPVPPDVTMLIKPGGSTVLLPPNTRKTSFKITPSTGAFSGTFTMTDANPLGGTAITRSGRYYGMVIPPEPLPTAAGFFMLDNLPRAAGQTKSNTDTVSGLVELKHAP